MKAKTSNLKVGTHRSSRRVWMQGNNLEHAGFQVGKFYDIKKFDNHIRLEINDTGKMKVSRKKKKSKNGEVIYQPVIELNSQTITDFFENHNRCQVVYWPDCIIMIALEQTNLDAELAELERAISKAA